jgi:hypothetical protein
MDMEPKTLYTATIPDLESLGVRVTLVPPATTKVEDLLEMGFRIELDPRKEMIG